MTETVYPGTAPLGFARVVRAALTHPISMRLKARARDARWRLRGIGLRNPPIPQNVRSITFVCLGNICRSPFAARRAEQLLHAAGSGHVRCTSAGIRPSQAARPPDEACEAATRYRVALDGHAPALLTREVLAAHDMTIVMEASQRKALQAAYPEFADRIFLLGLYDHSPAGHHERFNIADPFGHHRAAFDTCYARIDRALRSLIAALGETS